MTTSRRHGDGDNVAVGGRRLGQPPTWIRGRRCGSGSASRIISRVTGAVSPRPKSRYRTRCSTGFPSDPPHPHPAPAPGAGAGVVFGGQRDGGLPAAAHSGQHPHPPRGPATTVGASGHSDRHRHHRCYLPCPRDTDPSSGPCRGVRASVQTPSDIDRRRCRSRATPARRGGHRSADGRGSAAGGLGDRGRHVAGVGRVDIVSRRDDRVEGVEHVGTKLDLRRTELAGQLFGRPRPHDR